MASPPKEPAFEKASFPRAPWLPTFWELLVPFFRGLAQALDRQLTFKDNFAAVVLDGERRPVVEVPNIEAEPDYNLFIETTPVRPALVFVVAEPLPDQLQPPGNSLVQVQPEWMPATQGTQAGLKLMRLPGLLRGRRYLLEITVLGK